MANAAQAVTAESGGGVLSKLQAPGRVNRYTRTIRDMNASAENLEVVQNGRTFYPTFNEDSVGETALLKKNSDDEDDEPRCTQLTNQHKTAIRFLRKLKYFVARRKFKEALKPYDVKDVMEQYAAGHVDLLGRVKNVHARLDQILGKQGSKSKDAYASKISLASRVVKVERQVADIEEKLDILIKAYMEDRKKAVGPWAVQPQATLHNNHSTIVNSNNYENSNKSCTNGINKITISKTENDEVELWKRDNPIAADTILTTESASSRPFFSVKNINREYKKQMSDLSSFPVVAKVFEKHNEGFMTELESKTKKRVTLRSTSLHYEKKGLSEPSISIMMPPIDVQHIDAEPKSVPDSSIILIDEVEDFEEDDLNCEGEMDQFPTWDIDSDTCADVDADCDESTEDTALLHRESRTAIVITSISPVSSANNLTSLEEQTASARKSSNLLSPDSG